MDNVKNDKDLTSITIQLQKYSVKLTTTLISILLSLGSILIGISMGIKRFQIMRAMAEKNTAQFVALTTSRRDLQRLWRDIMGSTTNLAGRTMRRLSRRRR